MILLVELSDLDRTLFRIVERPIACNTGTVYENVDLESASSRVREVVLRRIDDVRGASSWV